MRAFGSFLLELTAFLSMCFMLAVLMGVPVLWALIGSVLLVDIGVVLFLKQGEPDDPGTAIIHDRRYPGSV
jgi:hypothetical protein